MPWCKICCGATYAGEEENINQSLLQEAVTLTGIGVATAFGLLVLLMAAILVVGWLSTHVLDRASRAAPADAEAHDKALAAIAAVAALRASAGRDRDGNA